MKIRKLAKDHKGYGSAATIAPSEPLFKQLGWMSIEQRIKYHQYLLVSKCLKNEVPVYLKKFLVLLGFMFLDL
jgi:hypothetical protein